MPDEAVMSEGIEFYLSRSGVECLFVEQGEKKMGGGDPLKISSRSFLSRRCASGGNRKGQRGGNKVGSV